MRYLTLHEGRPPTTCTLTVAEAATLDSLELAEVSRTPDGSWLVAAGSKVGVARLGELQVTVRPKMPIDRLIFLMGYAQQPAHWRDQSVALDAADGLVEALAHAFRSLSSRALEQGLLQGYRTVDQSLPVLRGRIRVADQISRRSGAGLPLEVTYDDFTVDIAENQILLAACLRLLRTPGVPSSVRHGLQRIRLQLADVSRLPTRGPLPYWRRSRLNARYHSALQLAELVLQGDSFEQRDGGLEVSGFVVDMWRVFEEFVSVALRESLAPYAGAASFQHRMHLDHARRVVLRPDFLWTGADGSRVVVDAKYKSEKPAGFPQADLYQLLAYCTVLGLNDGHLVYAKGNDEAVVHDVVGSKVRIHCHVLDLEATPQQLLAQVEALAARLASSRR